MQVEPFALKKNGTARTRTDLQRSASHSLPRTELEVWLQPSVHPFPLWLRQAAGQIKFFSLGRSSAGVLVYAVVSDDTEKAVETFVRRQDAERFVEIRDIVPPQSLHHLWEMTHVAGKGVA